MINFNVQKIMEKYADIIVDKMKKILIQNNRRATGKFINSLGYKISGNSIEFFGDEYGKFIQEGRKPGKQPPIEPLVAWLKVKKVSVGGGRLKPMVRRGKKAPSDSRVRGMAYVIARSIGKRGLKGTDYQKAMNEDKSKVIEEIRTYYINKIQESMKK